MCKNQKYVSTAFQSTELVTTLEIRSLYSNKAVTTDTQNSAELSEKIFSWHFFVTLY